MKHHANCVLLVAATALAACGGGGVPSTQPEDLAQQFDTGAGRAAISEQARRAANAIPAMGSVTQSSNTDQNGRTTDRASATFDGARMSLRISHADETSTQISASTSDFVQGASARSLFSGHSSGEWMERRQTNGRYQALIATISYSTTDTSDWLAGGLLITADGSGSPTGAGDVNQVAWIDGPEIADDVTLTSVSGTATYSGAALGNYTAAESGNLVMGSFQGGFQLTANFDDNTISGCVGCSTGGVRLNPYYTTEGSIEPDNALRPLEFSLGQTNITDAGIFNNGNVSIGVVSGTQNFPSEAIQNPAGKWGGRFSTRRLENGRPRAAAVAFGGSFTLAPATEDSASEAIVYQGVSLPTPSDS